jgi:hypothetical protein
MVVQVVDRTPPEVVQSETAHLVKVKMVAHEVLFMQVAVVVLLAQAAQVVLTHAVAMADKEPPLIQLGHLQLALA